jgi:Tol biopolymer transport system component/DNA-binding winged helix-turn-helix (wHTH) protein
MNRRPDQLHVSVDLAREPDFAIGGLRVCPSRRQVIVDDRQETIQPRVMQALVALFRATGAVVSREELIESCWDGIMVGDDAINRCISKVRLIAQFGGSTAFEIETVPRVGYRLRTLEKTTQQVAPQPETNVSVANGASKTPSAKPWQWNRIGVSAAALLSLLAAIGGALLLWPRPPLRWVVVQTELPIATSLIERHPAISPDGTMIAYSAGTDVLSRKIYLKRVSGGDPLQLTNDPYDDASPAWSPDGRQIAYVAYRQGEPCRLMVVPALAGAPHELARCRTDDRSGIVWSKSGEALFFVDRADSKSPDRIMRLDPESGQRAQLTHPSRGALDEEGPAVSPDGRWITFLRQVSESATPRILFDLTIGTERTLIEDDYTTGSAAWSSDSKSVFTIDSTNAEFEIWAHPIDGTSPQRIFSTPDELIRLNSGPHGLLAAEINRYMSGLARSPAQGSDRPQFFESENGRAFTPDVAADGSIVAALSRPDGAGLWVIPRIGPARKLISMHRDAAVGANPRWSPDGSRIAFTDAGSAGIRVIAITGAPVATIPLRGREFCSPAWSADGRSLIFPGRDDKGWRLWQVDLARPERLTALPLRGWISIRRYNNELYGVREGTPGVWRIDGTPHQIIKAALMQPDQWVVTRNSIAWLEYGKQRLIRAQPIGGGPARVLAQVPEYALSFGFVIDPVSGSPIYVARLALDAGDIELLHLVQQ